MEVDVVAGEGAPGHSRAITDRLAAIFAVVRHLPSIDKAAIFVAAVLLRMDSTQVLRVVNSAATFLRHLPVVTTVDLLLPVLIFADLHRKCQGATFPDLHDPLVDMTDRGIDVKALS